MSWLLFVPVLLVPWLGTPLPRRLGPARRGRIAGFAMIAATIWICAVFPKHLDRRVGPARYRDVSLRELGMELFRNHDIDCRLDVGPRPDRFDFDIPRPMTRREVLQKLADETGLRLHLRGCGTGETLLWGPHYSPRLSPKPGAPWR